MSSFQDFNQAIIAEFRANGGKVGGQFANRPMLLLNTTGAKSGRPRTNPLVYVTDGDRLVVFASKGGAPSNPDWYYNLLAHPNRDGRSRQRAVPGARDARDGRP